jgi:curli production assembly/transport component CsgG
MLQKLPCLSDRSLFKAFTLLFLLSGCSLLSIDEDTTPERFPSRDLDKPYDLAIDPALCEVPAPSIKPVVAVYPNGFTDQTGQRKSNSQFALFSSAITQQPSNLLIRTLKGISCGEFFRVVERGGLDNLTKERQLIRSTREQLEDTNTLLPLLFAGILFEGAVLSYETNRNSGGIGARYLGVGSSEMYRTDIVTVALRMVSVNTGEILIESSKTKTIYSHGSSQDVFKFIEAGTELVEIEFGAAKNESHTIALQKSIESAILEIITVGYDRGYWKHEE